MGFKVLAVAAAVLAGAALAGCPNHCGGHGSCSSNDVCTCFPGFEGFDCSLRTCPKGQAWATNAVDPHSYSECSAQGSCNRMTGDCDCFAGFGGFACTRMTCPNSCSGNGRCVLISEVPHAIAYSDSNWDAKRIETCECDAGYFGADCSQRYCPTGDDPLTTCDTTNTKHVQEVRFTLGSEVGHEAVVGTDGTYTLSSDEMSLFGTSSTTTFTTTRNSNFGLHLTYVDAHGAGYVTHSPISVLSSTDADARDSFEIALETLPARLVGDVKVATAMTKTSTNNDFNGGITNVIERRYLVTFNQDNSKTNVGIQNELQCASGYSCSEAGCQPMVSMPFLYRYAGPPAASAQPVGTAQLIGTDYKYYTADTNIDASAAAGYFIRLHPDSQPQMPFGTEIDTSITSSDLRRYDLRILVAIQDPIDSASSDDAVDVYYTRVIAGHTNIMASSNAVGSSTNGVWTNAMDFTTTLDGFTFNGPIPLDSSKVPVPGAPGVYITLAKQNYVTTNNYGLWYEILIKLPHCTVTANSAATPLQELGVSTAVPLVAERVENIECASRGSCNRITGQCECFSGFTGSACDSQTAIV